MATSVLDKIQARKEGRLKSEAVEKRFEPWEMDYWLFPLTQREALAIDAAKAGESAAVLVVTCCRDKDGAPIFKASDAKSIVENSMSDDLAALCGEITAFLDLEDVEVKKSDSAT